MSVFKISFPVLLSVCKPYKVIERRHIEHPHIFPYTNTTGNLNLVSVTILLSFHVLMFSKELCPQVLLMLVMVFL